MIVVCATDDNFIQHCSIMLVSLLINNRDVEIFVLTEGLKRENMDIIQKEVERYSGIVHFLQVDSKVVERFPMPQSAGLTHISRATYYRLLISDILLENIHKAIYLDCDIVINGSLQELWNMNLDGYALAAVPQIGCGYESERLGYPIEYGYFNAGVNMINLDYFRTHNITADLLRYIHDNYARIIYHDQDTLNAVLYDKTLHLLPQWNMTSSIYVYQLDKRGDSRNGKIVNAYLKEKENALKYFKNPIVLHYVSKPKPWQKDCVHPLYDLYYRYARETIHFSSIKKQSPLSRGWAVLLYGIKERLSALKQHIHRTDCTRL